MKQELEFKGFDPTPGIRSLIERQIERLDRKSQSLPGDVLFLRCAVEEVPVRKLTRVTVVLVVPQNTLAAKGPGTRRRSRCSPGSGLRRILERTRTRGYPKPPHPLRPGRDQGRGETRQDGSYVRRPSRRAGSENAAHGRGFDAWRRDSGLLPAG